MDLIKSQQMTMSSREIAELTGKQHGHVKRDIEAMLKALKLDASIFGRIYLDGLNRQQTEYSLDEEHTLCLTSGYDVNQRMAIIRQWKAKTAPVALPSYADALRLYADQIEQTARIAVERDNAIATKAEIGSRREATAMNTASNAVRKANRLERQLDKAKDYCTVKRMSMIHHGQPFEWRELKTASASMGIAPVDVFDQNYGTVKAYHADVWAEVYGIGVGDE